MLKLLIPVIFTSRYLSYKVPLQRLGVRTNKKYFAVPILALYNVELTHIGKH